MKLYRLLFLGVMLMCLCLTLSACVVKVDSKNRGYKEKNYSKLLKEYKDDFETDIMSQRLYENVVIAIDLCEQFQIKNELLEHGLIDKLMFALSGKDTVEAIGEYLGVQNNALKNLKYEFEYYYSPNWKNVFVLVKKMNNGVLSYTYKTADTYSFSSGLRLNMSLHDEVSIDDNIWPHVIRHTMHRYNTRLGGKFYPFIGVTDYVRDFNDNNLLINDLKKNPAFDLTDEYRYFYDVYFKMDKINKTDDVFDVVIPVDDIKVNPEYKHVDAIYKMTFKMRENDKSIKVLSFEKLY